MLRGINRSIIEINETEHRYFEKVLIFVKSEYSSLPISHLEKEAGKFIGNAKFYPVGLYKNISARKRRAKLKRKRIIMVLGVGLALTLATILITKLI